MKTKLGLSVGVLGAVTYLLGLFDGYTAIILVGGYILLCEQDSWLRKTVVKALAIMLSYTILYYLVDFIPELCNLVDGLIGIFGFDFYPTKLHLLIDFVQDGLYIIKEVIMLLMALLAFKQKTINVGPIDKLVD